jgi:1-acyl-sn-glycerol-3-phosphate acyltransferase
MDESLNPGRQSQTRRDVQRPSILPQPNHIPAFLLALPTHREGWLVARRVRVVRRLLAVLAWTLVCMPVQAILLLLPSRLKARFPRFFWAAFIWLLGIEVQTVGQVAKTERPIVFIANHSSWVDIPLLGGVVQACFVAKGDVAQWPVISWVARLGRTVFVSRSRGTMARERDGMRARLLAGDNLILFPEGTSSDGSRVLAFRSAFFSIAETRDDGPTGTGPLIQPVSLVYDRVGGLPAGRASRPLFAWYGDMDIASHFWRLGQYTGMRATVLLHPPIDPATFADRKQLAQAVWQVAADGAALLRQNRPVKSVASGGTSVPVLAAEPRAV